MPAPRSCRPAPDDGGPRLPSDPRRSPCGLRATLLHVDSARSRLSVLRSRSASPSRTGPWSAGEGGSAQASPAPPSTQWRFSHGGYSPASSVCGQGPPPPPPAVPQLTEPAAAAATAAAAEAAADAARWRSAAAAAGQRCAALERELAEERRAVQQWRAAAEVVSALPPSLHPDSSGDATVALSALAEEVRALRQRVAAAESARDRAVQGAEGLHSALAEATEQLRRQRERTEHWAREAQAQRDRRLRSPLGLSQSPPSESPLLQ
eukprot:TRINITY_DN24280_c0_g1_i3.p1 TRINITY_DN24280_c0_g1~~TRINITY_DN24280_c0_g1_i3.p1  ORF type:complete len:309 (+),score=61.89 TRINITY_DN24280_c0_g1_i3:135-929(+)